MRKWMILLLCLMLAACLWMPAAAGETVAFEPYYTPSTQEEARCLPLMVEQGTWDGSQLTDSAWHALYNPETAKMMVDLAQASSEIGENRAYWQSTMEKYGYEQLYYTENNEAFYPMGWHVVNNTQQPITFPAVNALVGIQEVAYNGMTRYAVAVTFRGSSDYEDWMCDFTAYSDEQGFHKGFSMNTQYFYETLSKQIHFTVEGKTYTLWDIYDQMKEPNSPFCMLVMGHSLGGALTNVLVGRYLHEHGVHPSNLAGYGFAVPRTAPRDYAAEYPYDNLFNIINADDLVPAITLAGHERIGRDLVFYPDDNFRLDHYGREVVEENPESSHTFWQTFGFAGAGGKPHFIKSTYKSIVDLISDEISASTSEAPSRYTKFSTCGYNNWGLFDVIITPYTFGDFPNGLSVNATVVFREGVLQVSDGAQVGALIMQNDRDYLLAKGNLDIGWGLTEEESAGHLSAGTVEIKGDFTVDRGYNFWQYPYVETGTHRTILSGLGEQTMSIFNGYSRLENLYLRNPRVQFGWPGHYIRLAEDALLVSTDELYINTLDLNGHRLTLGGAFGSRNLTMGGGTLQTGGNATIHTIQQVDGQMAVNGNLTLTETLPFAGGQLRVEGDCYLPCTLIMQNEEDYLSVGGNLTLFARDADEIPDDHLSAGTVEIKGDMSLENSGVCTENAYRETGTHKTILSGENLQTVWMTLAYLPNRFENLCIRNPKVSLNIGTDVRLGEDALIHLDVNPETDTRQYQVKIAGKLDLAGHDMTVKGEGWPDTAGWESHVWLKEMKPSGGSLTVQGGMLLENGTIGDRLTVTGDLKVDQTFRFENAQVEVGGTCTGMNNLVMQHDADYLLVHGDLLLEYRDKVSADHLTAGTVELKGDLHLVGRHDETKTYNATGTHRTIVSGTDWQTIGLGSQTDKRLQVCLRNPKVKLNFINTLVLMGDGLLEDASQCYLYGHVDLNGHTLVTQGTFGRLNGGVIDSSADQNGSTSGGLVFLNLAPDTCTVDVLRPALPENATEDASFETVHVLFTGYSGDQMMVYEIMSFTSESELSAALDLNNWPQCDRVQVFLLEGEFVPFCEILTVPTEP